MISTPIGSERTSTSISRSSSSCSRSILRNFCRVSESRACAGSSVEKPIMRGFGRQASRTRPPGPTGAPLPPLAHLLLAGDLPRDVGELLDDRVDVAPDVADLGKLGRLNL